MVFQGMLGTMMNLYYFIRLLRLKQPAALDYPRESYHKRQVALLGGVVVLLLCCAGDLGLAITHSAAYRETGYTSFTIMKVIAGLAWYEFLSCLAPLLQTPLPSPFHRYTPRADSRFCEQFIKCRSVRRRHHQICFTVEARNERCSPIGREPSRWSR